MCKLALPLGVQNRRPLLAGRGKPFLSSSNASAVALGAPPTATGETSAITYNVPAGGAGTYIFERPTGAVFTCSSGPSETTEDTQEGFSSSQITAQLSSLSKTVSNNVKGVLNGGGNRPTVTQNGFFLQTLGLAARRGRGVDPEWNLWIKGDYNKFSGNSLNGSQANLVFGLDFKPDPDTVVGGLLSYDTTDFTTLSAGTAGALDAEGYTLGVYGGRRMDNGLMIDGMLAYSALDYSVVNGAVSGAFDANRISMSVGISNRMEIGGMTVEPNANLIYARETQAAYTDSGATAHAEKKVTAGRLSLGPTIYFDPKDNGLAPWISVNAEYDFSDNGSTSAGSSAFADNLSLRAGFGFSLPTENGNLSFAVNAGGLGSGNYTSVGATLTYRMAF
ncbi:hypothetical protein RB2150_12561 [Rhodobacteraceae bacterium HTCC2150]|nr:hypothetical protein RB2150_12561 [Rhodobacteraceae bacterium HTCC2150]